MQECSAVASLWHTIVTTTRASTSSRSRPSLAPEEHTRRPCRHVLGILCPKSICSAVGAEQEHAVVATDNVIGILGVEASRELHDSGSGSFESSNEIDSVGTTTCCVLDRLEIVCRPRVQQSGHSSIAHPSLPSNISDERRSRGEEKKE